MSKFDCDVVSQFLSAHHAETGAPELHGLLTGYVCVNINSNAGVRLGLYEDWLEVRFDETEQALSSVLGSNILVAYRFRIAVKVPGEFTILLK